MRVLLIHGLGRTPLSLLGLARDLRQAGHRPQLVAYVGALESYRAIVARVRRHLQTTATTAEPYAAIGHSLGGLILRTALADWPAELPLPRCVVMLGMGSPASCSPSPSFLPGCQSSRFPSR